jgi:NAD+ synthase (glutamine-hydrolysing)
MGLRVAGAQVNLTVGDISGNEEKIAAAMTRAAEEGADVILMPELAISGYPPEDLVLRRDFVEANISALHRLARASGPVTTVVGFVDFATGKGSGAEDAEPREVANAAAVISDGQVLGVYHKVLLPNYGVFDEDRYFIEGAEPGRIWEIRDVPVGVSVCEDIWLPDGPPSQQAARGAKVLLNINASPFHRGKAGAREEMLASRARAGGASVVYVNLVGGQDELVFDGASVVIGPDGELLHRSPQFEEDFFVVEVPIDEESPNLGSIAPLLEPTEEIYRALTTGLRDYCHKNGFTQVIIGLSGGIDSAVTAAIAAAALGPQHVRGVSLPGPYSSDHSREDAYDLARRLGIECPTLPIEAPFQGFRAALDPAFRSLNLNTLGQKLPDLTEENLQSRIRGTTLMALSNRTGAIVLTTGNKSELAVGYTTLYGDMNGGYAVLCDVSKMQVYALARWMNANAAKAGFNDPPIPERSITKPPSAELRPNQTDQDSLPPYDILDTILERAIERRESPSHIARETGIDAATISRVFRLIHISEFKRQQLASGPKVTTVAFGTGRRYPIAQKWKPA